MLLNNNVRVFYWRNKMYCTVADLQAILPEKVKIGDDNIGTPTPGRPSSTRSNISPDQALQYIRYAQQYIDARLRPYYSCPLRRTVSFETPFTSTVAAGTDVSVTVHDSGSFGLGMNVRLRSTFQYEECTVSDVPDFTHVVLATVVNSYDGGELSVVEYPDPIPLVTARMACSYILDRLFTSEQSPDVSNYGKTQRNLARNSIDDILAGEVLLFGQEHTGYRFVRGSVYNAYKSPAEIQRGEERE
jgi:hypothetical protein